MMKLVSTPAPPIYSWSIIIIIIIIVVVVCLNPNQITSDCLSILISLSLAQTPSRYHSNPSPDSWRGQLMTTAFKYD